jgi:signal transduction histidine kinase
MNFLVEAVQQIYRWIIRPPGNVFYFLTTLAALQLAFLLALSARRQAPRGGPPPPPVRRWVGATGGLLLARLMLVVVGLLGTLGWIDPARFLPPMERALEFASVLLVLWAALLGTRTARWPTIALLVLLLVGLGFYGYTAIAWPSMNIDTQAFNGIFLEQVWEVMTTFFLLLHLLLALILRPPEWEWLVGMLLFWFLGHAAQLRWPDSQVHVSGWLRLTSLVTYPLLAVLVHRQLFAGERAEPVAPSTPLPDVDVLQRVLRNVETARELEPSLMLASSKLADLLEVDMCAIALSREEDPDSVYVVGLHPPNAAQIEALPLLLDAYPPLAEAYAQGVPRFVSASPPLPWLSDLYQKLGIEWAGPLAMLPLTDDGQRLGVLLLGNPERGEALPAAAQDLFPWVATLFATSLARARRQTQDKSLLARLRGQDVEVQKTQMALSEAQAEIKALNKRIAVLVQEIKSRDKEMLQLSRELEAQSGEINETELSFWQDEVRSLAEERDQMQRELREVSQDRDVLLEDRARLTEQLSDLRAQLEEEEEVEERLEARVTSLERELAEQRTPAEAVSAGGGSGGSAVGLVVADADGHITMADALARQMMRLPKGDVVGMPVNGAYPDPRWTQAIDALLAKDVPNGLRRAHLTLSVDDSELQAEIVKLVSRSGQTDGLAITLHSTESGSERQEAIVGLANEFRTPMTAMLGYTDLLLGEQAGILTEMQQQFLERVKANIEQMGRLLNDLVRTASPDSRPVELSVQSVNLIEIIEEAIMGLAARFRERKLAVQLDLPPELPPVEADRDSLYQILLRLLSNAALCSEEGSDVVISARESGPKGERDEDGYIRISVMDTGGGIAPEDYPRVFRRFYRASQPLIEGMGETGVGMAVAKALVEANDGHIWVDSEPGVGSTFSFVMPIAEG